MEVRLLDLVPQYETIAEEVNAAVRDVFNTQQFILGGTVRNFEQKMEDYIGISHAVGTASGSDAILLALMALGIGEGDEVITTPYTFFSTVSSITRLGAKPVFADIEPRTFNIDPERLESAITDKTAAVIAVHLFGQSADMKMIMDMTSGRGIPVVEDVCQSIGATHRGEKCGKIGDIGCLSFFPSKNLGGAGDGGMIITDRADLAEKVRVLRVHGEREKYNHVYIGINSRLDALQAAVLSVKLDYLDRWNAARRERASSYDEAFSVCEGIAPPFVEGFNESTYNQYVIRAAERDELQDHLSKMGIGTAIYYPLPLHLQECFRFLGLGEGDLPESEKAAEESLAIPVYPELPRDQQDYVISAIREFAGVRAV